MQIFLKKNFFFFKCLRFIQIWEKNCHCLGSSTLSFHFKVLANENYCWVRDEINTFQYLNKPVPSQECVVDNWNLNVICIYVVAIHASFMFTHSLKLYIWKIFFFFLNPFFSKIGRNTKDFLPMTENKIATLWKCAITDQYVHGFWNRGVSDLIHTHTVYPLWGLTHFCTFCIDMHEYVCYCITRWLKMLIRIFTSP